MSSQEKGKALSPYWVLDLTDEKGLFCGKLLADLGADVIMIENPGGSSARRIGPFYHDIPDLEKSLFWFAYNLNKRSITLDIETADGQEIFKRLVTTADIVVESFPPGYIDGLGLGYSSLSELKPDLVMTSITPFGPDGPYRNYKGSDLVLMALGGLNYISGDPELPPVRISYPQAYLHAGSHAAAGSLIALWHREMTGEGQHVDLSIQEATTWCSYYSPEFWDLTRTIIRRAGVWRQFGRWSMRFLFPCKDGFVSLYLLAGRSGAPGQKALARWAESEGLADDFLRSVDFDSWDADTIDQDYCNQMANSLAKFLITKTKVELFERAIKDGFFLAPVSSTEDLLENTQLKARGFWVEVEHPELGTTIAYPGAMMIATETPLRITRRAPLIGEHNQEIYERELGLSKETLTMLKGAGVI